MVSTSKPSGHHPSRHSVHDETYLMFLLATPAVAAGSACIHESQTRLKSLQ
jgi:hypothetical protein